MPQLTIPNIRDIHVVNYRANGTAKMCTYAIESKYEFDWIKIYYYSEFTFLHLDRSIEAKKLI